MGNFVTGPQCCANGITGYGSMESGIMFIGIAPGKDEALRTKRPLTGPSGKLLDAVLACHGIQRDSVYTTNLICWWKDAPDRNDIQVCSSRLQREIELVNPKIIVALGKLACESLFKLPFGKARGAILRFPLTNVPNVPLGLVTNHPAAALHTDNKEQQINAAYDLVRDLEKLTRLNTSNNVVTNVMTRTLINTPEAAQHLLDNLPTDVPVALDIETKYDKETDRSHPFSDQILCIGIGYDDNHCFVLTPPSYQGQGLRWPRDVKWLYHNGQFDTQEIAQHLGVWLPIGYDTMLESYCCDERSQRGLHKLKSLAREYVGADFYEVEEHHINDQDVSSYDKLYDYNAKDVCYTHRLHTFLTQRMYDEGTSHVYESLLLPGSEMLARSQYRGIYINPQHVEDIEATLGLEYIKLHLELHKLATTLGYPDLNLNSPIQLKAMLHAQGHYVANTTKYTLQDLQDTNPFVKKLLRYRTLERLIKVYLHLVLEQVKYDGRVHPHALLIGTVTGRLVYKDPPMQTLPKPKTVKDLGIIRKIFSATSDDYVLLEVDYAQIEAWLGAHFSGDPVLLSDLQSGNWHTKTTEDVFHITKSDVDPLTWAFYYDGGKHLNYGCMYKEGPEGLTRKPPIGLGCDINTARAYHQRWYQRYAVFGKYQNECQRRAREEAELVTPFGRKRRFPLIVNDHQLRQAVNYEIQSTASDYTLSSAIRLDYKLRALDLDAHLLFIEHDALYLEVAKSDLIKAVDLIKLVMESPPLPGLPSIKTEVDVGPNLAELERYEP